MNAMRTELRRECILRAMLFVLVPTWFGLVAYAFVNIVIEMRLPATQCICHSTEQR